ncbi:MAG: nucleoside-diphosphate-sugar epimerase [Planctomycetaceae bacterium]|jgi:nucleoside-diphosphate-sugar epimerase
MRRMIVGCGYLGRRVAARWIAGGDEVFALTRSKQNAAALRELGVLPLLGDVTNAASLESLPECDTILHAVGFDRSASASKREVYVGGLSNVLDRMAGRCGHFIHISSTSVYGQQAGEWVDEESPAASETESGEICIAAEGLVLDRFSSDATSGQGTVLRPSGIYGPDRLLSRIDALKNAQPLPGPEGGWLNLIHVDDAAETVVTCAEAKSLDSIYLVSDDRPILRGEYYRLLAKLVGAPEPIFDPIAVARHSRGINKRCGNRKLRDQLGVQLRYPDIESGLAHAVNSSTTLRS